MKITQLSFVELLAAKMGITFSEAERFIHSFKGLVYEKLAAGDSVVLQGFGEFSVSHRASRIGVNPRNPSQKITIPELNTPKFKAGEKFKQMVALKK